MKNYRSILLYKWHTFIIPIHNKFSDMWYSAFVVLNTLYNISNLRAQSMNKSSSQGLSPRDRSVAELWERRLLERVWSSSTVWTMMTVG